MRLEELKEAADDAFYGRGSLYANYNVGWDNGGATVSNSGKTVWSCSADEHKKLVKSGKIKIKGDTGLIRYLISIGIL